MKWMREGSERQEILELAGERGIELDEARSPAPWPPVAATSCAAGSPERPGAPRYGGPTSPARTA